MYEDLKKYIEIKINWSKRAGLSGKKKSTST